MLLCACGQPAECVGEYETCTGVELPACNDCCGHGNEDGHCRPIEAAAPWPGLLALAIGLAVVPGFIPLALAVALIRRVSRRHG